MLLSCNHTSRAHAQQKRRQRSNVPTRCSVIAHAKTPNYYDVLGVDIDASEDDIRTAYRRKAKELHPDINKSASAEDDFKQCKLAYETLTDESKRREYDQVHRVRRLNFFQDIDEEEELSQGWGRAVDPWEVHRKMWEKEEQNSSSSNPNEQQQQQQQQMSPEELLERLSRVMGGGQLGQWQTGGRLDPFGSSSSSEAWHRRVQEQTNDPQFNRGRSVYGRGLDGDGWGRPRQPAEWDPFRPGDDAFERRQGWQNPGRPEWQNPRRYDDDDDEGLGGRGGSTRGPGRGGIPGDGGFRGKPL